MTVCSGSGMASDGTWLMERMALWRFGCFDVSERGVGPEASVWWHRWTGSPEERENAGMKMLDMKDVDSGGFFSETGTRCGSKGPPDGGSFRERSTIEISPRDRD